MLYVSLLWLIIQISKSNKNWIKPGGLKWEIRYAVIDFDDRLKTNSHMDGSLLI
jgi:hypothetical protein